MTPEPTPTPEQIQKARELLSFEGKSERLSPIALVARLLARAEAAERERDAAFNKGQNHALKEISTYLDVTCPTYGAVKSAIQKLQSERDQWREDAKVLADELQMFHAYSSGRMPLSIDASDAITRAGGGE